VGTSFFPLLNQEDQESTRRHLDLLLKDRVFGVLTKEQRDALITHQYRVIGTPGARIVRFVQWQYKCLFGA